MIRSHLSLIDAVKVIKCCAAEHHRTIAQRVTLYLKQRTPTVEANGRYPIRGIRICVEKGAFHVCSVTELSYFRMDMRTLSIYIYLHSRSCEYISYKSIYLLFEKQ